MAERNAYAVLGLQKGASEQDIKNAFVELVKKYDPEVHTDRFMVVQGAYNKLKDPKRRAKEDLHTFNIIRGNFLFSEDEKSGAEPDEAQINSANDNFRNQGGSKAAGDALIKVLMTKSHFLTRKKLWAESIAIWTQIREIDPSHVRARNNLVYGSMVLGTSYALHELYEDACDLWQTALELNPDNVELLHNLALGCEKCGQNQEAARYWSEVIERWRKELNQDDTNEYLRECIIEAHRHHGAQAQEDARASTAPAATQQEAKQEFVKRQRQVLELKPDDFDASFQLANSLIEQREYGEAITKLKELTRKHPKNVEVLNTLGMAQLHGGSVEEAFLTWNKSLAIDSKNPQTKETVVTAHLNLGKQYRQKGMFTPALVHLKKLLRFMPKSAEVYMEIGATYDMKGDVRSAMQAYNQVIKLDPKNKTARKALNDLRMKR